MKKCLTIGRIVLESGIPFHGNSQKLDDGQSQVSNVAKLFMKNSRSYRRRLKVLMNKAVEEGVDLLLLPACTLICSNAGHLRAYRRDTQKIAWVVAGLLNIPSEKRVKENSVKTVAWFQGLRPNFIEPDTIHWLLCGKGFAVVTMQSKVKRKSSKFRTRMTGEKQISQPRVIVLSIKPQHFAPRQFKSIMTAVRNHRSHPQIKAVIQLFSNSEKSRIKNGRNTKQLNNEFEFQRHEISSESDGVEDCLDLFRYKWLRVELPN